MKYRVNRYRADTSRRGRGPDTDDLRRHSGVAVSLPRRTAMRFGTAFFTDAGTRWLWMTRRSISIVRFNI